MAMLWSWPAYGDSPITPGVLTELRVCAPGELPAGTHLELADGSFDDRLRAGVFEKDDPAILSRRVDVLSKILPLECRAAARPEWQCGVQSVRDLVRTLTAEQAPNYIGQEFTLHEFGPDARGNLIGTGSHPDRITTSDFDDVVRSLQHLDPLIDDLIAPESGEIDLASGIRLSGLAPLARNCGHPSRGDEYLTGTSYAYWNFNSPMGTAWRTLVEFHGYVTLPGRSTLQGSLLVSSDLLSGGAAPGWQHPWKSEGIAPESVSLLLESQLENGDWQLLHQVSPVVQPIRGGYGNEAPLRPGYRYDLHVTGTAAAGTYVRMRLVTNLARYADEESRKWSLLVHVHRASLFGAQCYPDFANPGRCLQR